MRKKCHISRRYGIFLCYILQIKKFETGNSLIYYRNNLLGRASSTNNVIKNKKYFNQK